MRDDEDRNRDEYIDGSPVGEDALSPIEKTAARHAAGKIQFALLGDIEELQNVLWGRVDPRTGQRSTHGIISRIEQIESGLWGEVKHGTRTGGMADEIHDLKKKASLIVWFAGVAMTAALGAALHTWIR